MNIINLPFIIKGAIYRILILCVFALVKCTAMPTEPTSSPSAMPTGSPSAAPSTMPTVAPSASPSTTSGNVPESPPGNTSPTSSPSVAPSTMPTVTPSASPSTTSGNVPEYPRGNTSPTSSPSVAPSTMPTVAPSASPSTTSGNVPESPPGNRNPRNGSPCRSGTTKVEVDIHIDRWGWETEFGIKNSNDATVMEGSGWPKYSKQSFSECLPSGRYTFKITDSYGDGLCCNSGRGGYTIKVDDEQVESGGNFHREETKTFQVGSSSPGNGSPGMSIQGINTPGLNGNTEMSIPGMSAPTVSPSVAPSVAPSATPTRSGNFRKVNDASCAGVNTLSRQCGSAWNGAAAYCCPGLICNGYECVLPQSN